MRPLLTIAKFLVLSLSSIATTPNWPAACSLQPMTWVGDVSFGHNAIWSRFGAPVTWATVLTLRPFAAVTSKVGSAVAAAGFADIVDEASTALSNPNSWLLLLSRSSCTP